MALVMVIVAASAAVIIKGQYALAAEPTVEQALKGDKTKAQEELDEALEAKKENELEIIELEYDLGTKRVLGEEIEAKIRRLRREVRKIDSKLGVTNPLTLDGSTDLESNEPSN